MGCHLDFPQWIKTIFGSLKLLIYFLGESGQLKQSAGPDDTECDHNVGDAEQFDDRRHV